jgi:hypothetical protein
MAAELQWEQQLEQVPLELTVTAADSVLGKDGLMESTVTVAQS